MAKQGIKNPIGIKFMTADKVHEMAMYVLSFVPIGTIWLNILKSTTHVHEVDTSVRIERECHTRCNYNFFY